VDELVKAMGMTGISKSQVSRLCAEIDERVNAFTAGPGSLDRFLLRLGGSVCRVDDARFLSSLRQLLVQAQSGA
jgi:transposase-like protein